MRWWARLGLRGKLFLAVAAVLIGLLATTLAAVQLQIEEQTRATLREGLRVTGSVFHRQMRERTEVLVAGAELLASDFALKRAIATRDPGTLESVAVNHQRRIDVDLLWIADEAGILVADSRGKRAAGASVAATPPVGEALRSGETTATLGEVDGELYRLVCVPVFAVDLIGLLVLGERIDDATAQELQESTGTHVAFTTGDRVLAASSPPPTREALATVLPVSPGPDFIAEIDGERYFSLAVPVEAESRTPVVALLQRSYDSALAPLLALRLRILLIGLGALALALLVALGMAAGINAPIQRLVDGTRQIMQGNLGHRVPEERADELGFLAGSFNRMSERVEQRERELTTLNAELESRVRERTGELEASYRDLKAAQVQLVQSEKMASLGVLVAGVAHEINNPVTFVANNIHPLKERLTELREAARLHPEMGLEAPVDELSEIADLIGEGALRTAGIVQDLRNFSRLSHEGTEWVDVHENLEACLRLLHPRWAERITIERDFGDVPKVEAASGQLNQVLMNLLANACDAIDGRGTIRITTRVEGDRLRLGVRDDGSGIAPEDLERIFDPFFTTKPQGQGTGLGLSITHGIVTGHGGEIRVESAPGKGTEVVVMLPLRRARPDEAGANVGAHAR
ncbi:MAG: ATP-binding protein [Thermodesulfobacteriota bacterium]